MTKLRPKRLIDFWRQKILHSELGRAGSGLALELAVEAREFLARAMRVKCRPCAPELTGSGLGKIFGSGSSLVQLWLHYTKKKEFYCCDNKFCESEGIRARRKIALHNAVAFLEDYEFVLWFKSIFDIFWINDAHSSATCIEAKFSIKQRMHLKTSNQHNRLRLPIKFGSKDDVIFKWN